MIRVLHYGLNKNLGGIERSLDRLWTNIDRDRYHFDFIDEWHGRAFFRGKFESMGSRFYTITPRRESIIGNRKDWDRIPKNEYPDILHCHFNTLSYTYPVDWALKREIPVIVHSRSSGMEGSALTNTLHHANQLRLKKAPIYRLAVSNEAGRWLFGNGARYKVINNGVDIKKCKYSEEKRNRIRAELKISSDEFVIGNVGHLSAEKNINFIIDVYAEYRKKNSNSRLLIVGDGPLRVQIKNRIRSLGLGNSVILTGHKKNAVDYLSAMDVFVMPSISEGFPNAALEAQASGLRCIMSNTITREVDAGGCVYLGLDRGIAGWTDQINQGMECNRIMIPGKIDMFSAEREVKKISYMYCKIAKMCR